MQRVIGRKLYDTDRAEQIAQYAPNKDRSDLYYLVETLYEAAGGGYFLHCEGGQPNTPSRVAGAARLAVRRSNLSTGTGESPYSA